MTASRPRIYLVAPPGPDADAFAAPLREACRAGDVAAVLFALAEGDERRVVNRVKQLAPVVQESGAAALVWVQTGLDPSLVSTRGGADGVHLAGTSAHVIRSIREGLGGERIVGAGGLRTRDDAMAAAEAGADYVMFGEPRADGSVPPPEAVAERASWWAEIFETPCVAFAAEIGAVGALAATGAEFIALGDAVWSDPRGPAAAVADVQRALAGLEEAR